LQRLFDSPIEHLLPLGWRMLSSLGKLESQTLGEHNCYRLSSLQLRIKSLVRQSFQSRWRLSAIQQHRDRLKTAKMSALEAK
jgi:hypothetical protein